MKSKNGFTLIELLVTVFIIGVIAMLVVINTVQIRKKSRDTKRKADISDVANAIEMYYSSKHQFPGRECALLDLDGLGDINNPSSFLSRPPYDPLCKNQNECEEDVSNYKYMKTENGHYCIFTHLENKNDSDIKDVNNSFCATSCNNFSIPSEYNYYIDK